MSNRSARRVAMNATPVSPRDLVPSPAAEGAASTSDWVFNELWRRIVTRAIAPGQKITEVELCSILDVSRTPLRAAVQRLQDAGLIERNRNRTMRVAPLSRAEVRELSLVRERLECLVAAEAARRVAERQLSVDELRDLVAEMEALGGVDHGALAVLRLGQQFHFGLCRLSGLKRVEAMLADINLSLRRYQILLNENVDRTPQLVLEHREILEAVAAGDADAAESRMRAHIDAACRLYLKHMTVPEDPAGATPQ